MQPLAFLLHLCAQVLDLKALPCSQLGQSLELRFEATSLLGDWLLLLFDRRSLAHLLGQLSSLIKGLVQLVPALLEPVALTFEDGA